MDEEKKPPKNPPQHRNKIVANFRLSAEGKRLLAALAERCGLFQTGVIEMLIRDRARKDGVR